jgi:predicted NUDIX family phosphoesterase
MSERVLVVRRGQLFHGGRVPSGYEPGDALEYLDVVGRDAFFAPRPEAEDDPELKQIIPYGVVVHGDAVFLLRRSRRGAESRLHERYSLGVGGHINPPDVEGVCDGGGFAERGRTIVDRAFRREVIEELALGGSFSILVAGVLNDDSEPVGRVHFGIVYWVHSSTAEVKVREETQLAGGFVHHKILGEYAERMESWSRFLVPSVEARLRGASAR